MITHFEIEHKKRISDQYTAAAFLDHISEVVRPLADCTDVRQARNVLWDWLDIVQRKAYGAEEELHPLELVVVRDCIRTFRMMFSARKENRAKFSIVRAIWDVACGRSRPDLTAAFWADIIHLVRGGLGRSDIYSDYRKSEVDYLEGRQAACARSEELDDMWENARRIARRYPHGMLSRIIARRDDNRDRIMKALGASPADWMDWRWQIRNVVRDVRRLEDLVVLSGEEKECVRKTREAGLPFGVTPHYISLMDNSLNRRNDHAVRAQVLPDRKYVEIMAKNRGRRDGAFDFMLERDTSPEDLITRRYPTIVIFKPYNTCPQICVYCQRNWEIDDVLDPYALASSEQIVRAISWLRQHRSITEVLVTGGDPLVLSATKLHSLLGEISDIDHIQRIRIGTRMLVTMPMRITDRLVDMLAGFRIPGRREIVVVTHVEHAYELNPDLVNAVEKLRQRGISVYNQMVFTFENSRRFEASQLRRLLRLCGVEPYYTFNAKGKEETERFRVPMARLLQEQKEEARLLSGLDRTDEAVYNVPRLGKNYLRAAQHRDIISILPDGRRVYEFHPWEKKMMLQETFIIPDVAILPYLEKLAQCGEDPDDYRSIWYYF